MGAIAGPNIIVMMLTAMEHDLQAKYSMESDSMQLLSMQSIFFGNQKAMAYQQINNCAPDSPRYKQIMNFLAQIEARENAIKSYEKTIEMRMKQLETQLKIVQQRKESAQKMLEQNIQSAFKLGGR